MQCQLIVWSCKNLGLINPKAPLSCIRGSACHGNGKNILEENRFQNELALPEIARNIWFPKVGTGMADFVSMASTNSKLIFVSLICVVISKVKGVFSCRRVATGRTFAYSAINGQQLLETIEFPKGNLQSEVKVQNQLGWVPAPELIQSQGYPVNEYEVKTQDGYILRLLRIPGKSKTSTPVLIQHGLYNSCRDWLVPAGKDPLPYQLHDAGFDVWLASNRGTTYSKHVKYSPKESQFWDYTNTDIAKFDHPAVLDFVLETTKNKIVCIGYSWSGYTFMMMLTTNTRYNSMLERFIGIAPYISSDHVDSPVKYLAQPNIIKAMVWALSKSSLTENGRMIPEQTRPLLQKLYLKMIKNPRQMKLSEKYIAAAVGVSEEGTCMNTIGTALYEFPNDASIQCVSELLANMTRPKFCSSYFKESEPKESNEPALLYDLSLASVPKTFYFMENDTVVTVKDGRKLMQLCGPNSKGYIIKGFNHADAMYGRSVGKLNAEVVSNLKSSLKGGTVKS